jgi:hypothetical protein
MHHPVALTQKVGTNINNLAKTISVAVDSIRCAWGRNVESRGFLCDSTFLIPGQAYSTLNNNQEIHRISTKESIFPTFEAESESDKLTSCSTYRRKT